MKLTRSDLSDQIRNFACLSSPVFRLQYPVLKVRRGRAPSGLGAAREITIRADGPRGRANLAIHNSYKTRAFARVFGDVGLEALAFLTTPS